jgi:hypothetical protein
VDDKRTRVVASSGLAVGAVFGIAGTFAPSPALRGVAWGIDGVVLVMISTPPTFSLVVRGLGLVAAALFAATAFQIFAGAPVTALTAPLPFHAYPVLVAAMAGWIWTLMTTGPEPTEAT